MSLKPFFSKVSREELQDRFTLDFSLSDWVQISLPFSKVCNLDEEIEKEDFNQNDLVNYETNRYDVSYFNYDTSERITCFFYMNEDSNSVIAVDNVVASVNFEGVKYPIKETPFLNVINFLESKKIQKELLLMSKKAFLADVDLRVRVIVDVPEQEGEDLSEESLDKIAKAASKRVRECVFNEYDYPLPENVGDIDFDEEMPYGEFYEDGKDDNNER